MNLLLPEQLEFRDKVLIEASAGTGKTYTISNLYLRLVIGHKCTSREVNEILIVTFTNAATDELYDRVLKRLRFAYRAFLVGDTDDTFVQKLLLEVDDLELATQKLLVAIQSMDLAAIFTIHGFCQRVLAEQAFESGQSFELDFVLDDSDLIQRSVADYWRSYVSTADESDWMLFRQLFADPQALLFELLPAINRGYESQNFIEYRNEQQSLLKRYTSQINDCKKWWRKNDVTQALLNANFKKNTLLAKPDLIASFEEFCLSSEFEFRRGKSSWELFSPEKINKAKTAKTPDLSHLSFEVFEDLSALQAKLNNVSKLFYFHHAYAKCVGFIEKYKTAGGIICPNDLLQKLEKALTQSVTSAQLKQRLLQKYPIAMVDEFQDTDQTQFNIFNTIYSQESRDQESSSEYCFLMIGDPKQAIYGFRGGDIFTYISAKFMVPAERHFTIQRNWRSQSNLVEVVNGLFQNSSAGFIYQEEIPFYPVDSAISSVELGIDKQALPAFNVRYLRNQQNETEPQAWSQVSDILANDCAQQIISLIQAGTINGSAVQNSDICVLVRDRNEARLVKQALAARDVQSSFLVKDSVFQSESAYFILLLVNAIYHFRDETVVKAALLTPLFGFEEKGFLETLSSLNKWQNILEVFHQARNKWEKSGIYDAIWYVLIEFDVVDKLLTNHEDAHRIITDLRHLSEVLQNQSSQLTSSHRLLKWYEETLVDPLKQNEQQWRLESSNNLVQITTMHASKGLQYPIVFIPFLSRYKSAAGYFYHDDSHNLQLDVLGSRELELVKEKERLAEDIRLLYVALTRAKYHCCVGVWNNKLNGNRRGSGFVQTALGQLIFGQSVDPKAITDEVIIKQVNAIFQNCDFGLEDIDFELDNTVASASVLAKEPDTQELTLSVLSKPILQEWFLTSYSALSRLRIDELSHLAQPELLGLKAEDEDTAPILGSEADLDGEVIEPEQDIRFSFQKGAEAGSFLHEVLELADWHDAKSIMAQCELGSEKYALDTPDLALITNWIQEVLVTPFQLPKYEGKFSLNQLYPKDIINELEFHLPLISVDEAKFNEVVSKHTRNHHRYYQVKTLNGMLKGFLDLTFYWRGKFYVADYKSNYLGAELGNYNQECMAVAMDEHDYLLQSLLYTLALHRFLKGKIRHYDFDKHVGGALYLFLRGMSTSSEDLGVFDASPEKSVVLELDALFSDRGKSQ